MCHLHFSAPTSHARSKVPRTGFMYLHRRPGGRMQSGDRDPAQAGRHALGPLWCQHHHRSALFQTKWTIRGFMGTSLTEGRGRCLTSPHKSELYPIRHVGPDCSESESRLRDYDCRISPAWENQRESPTVRVNTALVEPWQLPIYLK